MYPFIYTHFFTASHIVITEEEPGIILPGVYTNTITGKTGDISLYCTFAQLNDILHCDGSNDDNEIAERLAYIISNLSLPYTLDVTATGGLECGSLLYCMQLLPADVQDDDTGEPAYYLRAFIKNEISKQPWNWALPQQKEKQCAYYLLLLLVHYHFYLHFIKEKLQPEAALYYASLEDPLVFNLAKTHYEIRALSVHSIEER